MLSEAARARGERPTKRASVGQLVAGRVGRGELAGRRLDQTGEPVETTLLEPP